MAEDFGDDAAQQLYDWLFRAGSLATQTNRSSSFEEALNKLADRLRETETAKKTQELPDRARDLGNNRQDSPKRIRLNMGELKEIGDFEQIKSLIDTGLRRRGIPHRFVRRGNESYLDFYLTDAPKVSAYLNHLIKGTRQASQRLQNKTNSQRQRGELNSHSNRDKTPKDPSFFKKQISRDTEPLKARATRVREASQTMEARTIRNRDKYKEKSSKRKERFK